MSSVRIVDKRGGVLRDVDDAVDRLLGSIAVDVERESKRVVPVKTGRLQSSFKAQRRAKGVYVLAYNTKYAAYQHAGQRQDGSRKVKRYTTPGTGKGFLEIPIQTVIKRFKGKIRSVMKLR